MTPNYNAWWGFCQRPEYDGHAADSAPGETFVTRWGFTFPTWCTARRWLGLRDCSVATFNAQTQADMGDLAHRFFWSRQGGDGLPAGSDVSTIDWLWTSGGAAFDIQRRVGFQAHDLDGVLGPRSVSRITACGPAYISDVHKWRVAYYDDHGFRAVYPGLYRRADACLVLSQALAAPAPLVTQKPSAMEAGA